MADHVILDANSQTFFCKHCGGTEPIQQGQAITAMVASMEAFSAAHAACPRPYLPPPWPRPDRPLPVPAADLAPWPGLEDWLRHGRVGLSSLTLATAITGLPLQDRALTPADPADFVRCLGLLKRVPSMRDHLHTSATRERLGSAWEPILDDWEDLEARVQNVDDESVYERLRRWADMSTGR